MKSIQVHNDLHKWLLNQKTDEHKSIDAVIREMRSKIYFYKVELEEPIGNYGSE